MSQPNPFLKSIRNSAGLRLGVLFGSFFIGLVIASIISLLIDKIPLESNRDNILLSSIFQSLLAFCVPAFLLAKFASNNWKGWLYLSKPPKLKAIIGVLIVYGLSLPAMEWLVEWNSNLHLPESLSSVESILRRWEDNAAATTEIILQSNGWMSAIWGILIVGILTGFSEELFFRGGLQGIFMRTPLMKGYSVWFAAFIFSVMHFQFFGFLPRLLMGAFFGYLLLWTKSIWVPVFAHALNNSMVVVTAALTGNTTEGIWSNSEGPLTVGYSLSVICSFILTAIFFYFCKDSIFKSNKSTKNQWQKSQLPPVSGR